MVSEERERNHIAEIRGDWSMSVEAQTALDSVARELQMIFNSPERRFWLSMFGSMGEGLGVYSRDHEDRVLNQVLGRVPSELERWYYRCSMSFMRDVQRQTEAAEGVERIKKAVISQKGNFDFLDPSS